MQYRTPLATARGLGSAKTGTAHWWMQRVTAVVLIPLSFFILKFIDLTFTADYQQTVTWLQSPANTVCTVAWILAVFYHAALGLQVVIEDYVAGESSKIIAIWTANLIFLFLALAALIGVVRIVLAG